MLYRYILFFIGFQFSFLPMLAQEQVPIATSHFNIDLSNRIILINEDLETLNTTFPGSKTSIRVDDKAFVFDDPIVILEKGVPYEVKDEWNSPFHLYFSELPIINIQTPNTILDDPRVYAQFCLVESNGLMIKQGVGIEIRGGSSQSLPKKSFRIEFWKDTLGIEKEDVSILGMRNDDDWNLDALAFEPLRLRSKIGYELWRKMDTLYYQDIEPNAINGIRQEFIELFLNGSYHGVYSISERVDRKQLKLQKKETNQLRGELYKGIAWGGSTFTNLPGYSNNSKLWGGFKFEYPMDTIEWSMIYNFVDFLINSDTVYFYENYQSQFAIDNAVNYFIFLNLLNALDNTGKNIFIGRYDQAEPYFYIPWDLNGSFGLAWNGNIEVSNNDILSNGFYDRLIREDSPGGFLEKLVAKWTLLRNQVITTDAILESFNTQFDYLKCNGVYERESIVWENFNFQGENDLLFLENWLTQRISFLDEIFYNPELITSISPEEKEEQKIKIFPNPAKEAISWSIQNNDCPIEKILLIDSKGNKISDQSLFSIQNKFYVGDLQPGLYFVHIEFCDGSRKVERLVVKREG